MNSNTDWIKFGAGMVHLKKGDERKAELIFKGLISENPSFAHSYEQLGYLRKNEGKAEQSLRLFKKAIQRMPQIELGYYHRGLLQFQLKRFGEAAHSFLRVMEMNPYHTDAMVHLALSHGKKGDFDKAERWINEAYSKDKGQRNGFSRLGWQMVLSGEWSQIFEIMKKDYDADRMLPHWQLNFAIAAGRAGNYKKAIELIGQAYEKNRFLKDGYARLGWIKTESHDWSGAALLMNMDLKKNRISPVWKGNLAQVVARKGEWDHAVELIEDAYESDKDVKDAFARLGWIKTERQDWNGASAFMRLDAEKNRLSPKWIVHWAMLHVYLGERDAAVEMIEKLYANDKDAVDGYAKLGWACYQSSQDVPTLRSLVGKDVRLNRISIDGERIKSWTMSLEGHVTEAIQHVDSIYAKSASLRDGFAILGWLCISNGDMNRGLELMEMDHRLKRLSPVWRANYAYQLSVAGRGNEAQALFNKLLQVESCKKEFRIGIQAFPLKILTKSDFKRMIEGNDSVSV